MTIEGRFFDGFSAAGVPAVLECGDDGVARLHGAPTPIEARLAEVTISERLGTIPRRLGFPGGGVFETHDNDAIDHLCDQRGLQQTSALVHWLESRWPVALGSLVAVVVVSIAFMRWGVPAIANWTASVIPAEVDRSIGSQSLQILDRVFFEKSKLPPDRQRELRARFTGMTAPLDDGHVYEIQFRAGKAVGANALALPSGIVIMTDELIALARSDDEIVAVMAHEIGHVRGRHALRQMLQAAGVSALMVAVLGDVSSISGILSAAPALLHAKHSRDFEREADAFSKQWLREHDIPESSFDAILCRMSESHRSSDSPRPSDSQTTDYFSSHPPTSERARCK